MGRGVLAACAAYVSAFIAAAMVWHNLAAAASSIGTSEPVFMASSSSTMMGSISGGGPLCLAFPFPSGAAVAEAMLLSEMDRRETSGTTGATVGGGAAASLASSDFRDAISSSFSLSSVLSFLMVLSQSSR